MVEIEKHSHLMTFDVVIHL